MLVMVNVNFVQNIIKSFKVFVLNKIKTVKLIVEMEVVENANLLIMFL